ncbi:hypothetical protein A6769_00615 [Nostoc punctiforme NIES-2108]|uniref:Uncharacterized protein n=1 Tax=Nostoc punctiforme NIES-2108 TaxID=1356359 RepID=A0A367S1Z1_NOSPU|nr:hypothetical protein A6769_00615 [Nostoc punctiforme NIES-2108]
MIVGGDVGKYSYLEIRVKELHSKGFWRITLVIKFSKKGYFLAIAGTMFSLMRSHCFLQNQKPYSTSETMGLIGDDWGTGKWLYQFTKLLIQITSSASSACPSVSFLK